MDIENLKVQAWAFGDEMFDLDNFVQCRKVVILSVD
jgi:hypothetical protein